MTTQSFIPYKYGNIFHIKIEGYSIDSLFSKSVFTSCEGLGVPISLPSDTASFLLATKELIAYYAEQFATSKEHDHGILIEYINQWGPILLTNDVLLGSEDTETYNDDHYFQCFQAACYNAQLLLSLWGYDSKHNLDILNTCKTLADFLKQIFNVTSIFFNTSNFDSLGTVAPQWHCNSMMHAGFWQNNTSPTTYRSFPSVGTFLPIEFATSKADLTALSSNLNDIVYCRNWLKNKFLQAVATNIAVSEVSVVPHISDEILSTDFILHNNLLFFIKYNIERSLRLCACGCGKEIPSGNKLYYDTVACYQRLHNKADPRRSIKQTYTSRHNRSKDGNGITSEQLYDLHNLIDRLYKIEHKATDVIKDIVNQKYDEFIASNQRKDGNK